MIDNHFQIGEVAERVGLSLRTIRYYEEIGLVTPSGRTEGGFRLYTDADVERLRLVKALKPVGMSLDTLGELVECVDLLRDGGGADAGEAESRLEGVVADALRQCDEMEDRLAAARDTLDRLSVRGARASR
ncbi:MAG TPA: MerR family transcriptional regulator [Acidimicrobiia bacterium]